MGFLGGGCFWFFIDNVKHKTPSDFDFLSNLDFSRFFEKARTDMPAAWR